MSLDFADRFFFNRIFWILSKFNLQHLRHNVDYNKNVHLSFLLFKKKAKIGEWGIGEISIATRRKSVYIIFKVENLITN